jgi:hypothetical protein
MNRKELLELAEQYVSKDRNQQYGGPEASFFRIADYWNVYKRHKTSYELDAYDVALMMILMKVARAEQRPDNPDSLVDIAGYAACAVEALTKDALDESSSR